MLGRLPLNGSPRARLLRDKLHHAPCPTTASTPSRVCWFSASPCCPTLSRSNRTSLYIFADFPNHRPRHRDAGGEKCCVCGQRPSDSKENRCSFGGRAWTLPPDSARISPVRVDHRRCRQTQHGQHPSESTSIVPFDLVANASIPNTNHCARSSGRHT